MGGGNAHKTIHLDCFGGQLACSNHLRLGNEVMKGQNEIDSLPPGAENRIARGQIASLWLQSHRIGPACHQGSMHWRIRNQVAPIVQDDCVCTR